MTEISTTPPGDTLREPGTIRKSRLGIPLRSLRGLRVQLFLWTVLPLAVALIVLSFAGVFRHRQVMQHMMEDRDRSLVLAEGNTLGRAVDRRSTQIAGAATSLGAGMAAPSPSELAAVHARLGPDFGGDLALLDARGGFLSSASGTAPAWAGRAEVTALAQAAAASGESQNELIDLGDSAGASQHAVVFAAPAPGGRVLLGAVPLSRLGLADAAEHLATETGGAVFILDETGRIIFGSDPSQLGTTAGALGSAIQAAHASAIAGPSGHGSAGGHAGFTYLPRPGRQTLLLAFASVDPAGWHIVSAEDLSQMNGSGLSVAEVLPMVLLFVAVLGLLAISFGMAAIIRPLQELDRRAARVAWGEFDAVAQPVGGIQEIDDLRDTLAQMAARIRSYQSGMRDYLSATTQAQEEERARLAHELHDDTVQSLIALKQRAQMARKAVSNDPERASARLDELTGLIDQELLALRRFIGDLRPIYLEDLGFVPALEMLAKQTEERHKVQVAVHVYGAPVRLAPDLELAAYRIVQQALANVVTHAAAHQAVISVTFKETGLILSIHDDGRGFTPPDQPADLARNGHYGVMGMRERAMLYGGHLTVASASGQGTTVTANLPIG